MAPVGFGVRPGRTRRLLTRAGSGNPRHPTCYRVDAVRAAGHTGVLGAFEDALAAQEHAAYEVRRLLRPRKDDPTRSANAARSVRRMATGTREEMVDLLAATAGDALVVGEDRIGRAWLRTRGVVFPTGEHFLVVAPAVVLDKQADGFEGWWAGLGDAEAAAVAAAPAPDLALW